MSQEQYWTQMRSFGLEENLIPHSELTRSSTTMLRSHLVSLFHDCHRVPEQRLLEYLAQLAHELATRPDPQLWGMFLALISNLSEAIPGLGHDTLRELYYLNSFEEPQRWVENAFSTLTLLRSDRRAILLDSILIYLARGLVLISSDSNSPRKSYIKFYLEVLISYERAIGSSQISQEASREGRLLREALVRMIINNLCLAPEGNRRFLQVDADLVDVLASYLRMAREVTITRTEDTYHDDVEISRLVCDSLNNSLRDGFVEVPRAKLLSVVEPLNEIAADARRRLYQMNHRVRRVRDPEERWCHYQEEPLLLRPCEIEGWDTHQTIVYRVQMLLPSRPKPKQCDSPTSKVHPAIP